MTARALVGFVMVQLVPQAGAVAKRFLHALLAEHQHPEGAFSGNGWTTRTIQGSQLARTLYVRYAKKWKEC